MTTSLASTGLSTARRNQKSTRRVAALPGPLAGRWLDEFRSEFRPDTANRRKGGERSHEPIRRTTPHRRPSDACPRGRRRYAPVAAHRTPRRRTAQAPRNGAEGDRHPPSGSRRTRTVAQKRHPNDREDEGGVPASLARARVASWSAARASAPRWFRAGPIGDWAGKAITVQRRVSDGVVTSYPKTERSRRRVPLTMRALVARKPPKLQAVSGRERRESNPRTSGVTVALLEPHHRCSAQL
jgi:hypothetical protein